MKKQTVLGAVVTTAILFTGAVVFAQDDDEQRGGHRGFGNTERIIQMMTRRLELDDVQSQQVEGMIEAAKPELDVLRDKRRAHHDAMRSLDVSDPDYGAQLDNLSVDVGELAAESIRLLGRLRAEVYSVLTPAQQQKLDEALGQRLFGDRTGRNHHGRRRGPGWL